MILRIILVIFIGICNSAIAETKLSLMGSILHNEPILKIGEADKEAEIGYGAGLRILSFKHEHFSFRTGAMIVQKNFAIETQDLSYIYLQIPLTLHWKFSTITSLFGGLAFDVKLSDECLLSGRNHSCSVTNNKLTVLAGVLGLDFSLTDSFGLELSYVHGLTEIAQDIRINSVIASLLYHFN